jgi:hypothetical protein
MGHIIAWTIAWALFALGAFICLLNFYLSCVRYPLHRWRGLPKEAFQWVSGFPLVGSLFVALSLLWLHQLPVMIPIGIAMIVVDTGGIHWFLGVLVYQLFHQIYELFHVKRRG